MADGYTESEGFDADWLHSAETWKAVAEERGQVIKELDAAIKAMAGPAFDWARLERGCAIATELLADAERLDWLDSVTSRTNSRHGTAYGWRFDANRNRAALTDHNLPLMTVREAIDAAMRDLP